MFKLVENESLCCGCTACKNVCPFGAISINPDEKGFSYPEIDGEKCVECGLCKKSCAFQNEIKVKNVPTVYAAKASDSVREKSASGGAFTVLSDVVLNNGGVVYGVKFNDDLKAVHTRAEDEKERDLCKNSKYSQSDMEDIFLKIKKDVDDNKQVLFTGTPCQVDAVRNFVGENENLFLVDILCHGVLSPKLFSEYISFIEKKRHSRVAMYYHRPKDLGWGHYEKAVYENGREEIETSLMRIWKNVFYTDACLRPSCYECKYANTPRCSDITIADFWGIEGITPDFSDEKGVSLVLVNSQKGEKLFENAKEKLLLSDEKLEDAKVKNPNLYRPTKPQKDVLKFWEDYMKNGFSYIAKVYGGYNVKIRLKRFIKKLIKR